MEAVSDANVLNSDRHTVGCVRSFAFVTDGVMDHPELACVIHLLFEVINYQLAHACDIDGSPESTEHIIVNLTGVQ